MTSRILVADDSLTIQKVIGITLANSGYELIECLNETELLQKIQSNHYELILLDFNLSDTRSGYELAKIIKKSMPGASIIVMLGTFDTIDESQFKVCGITDKIVKPFESTKFIKKCRDLLEGSRSTIDHASESTEVVAKAKEENTSHSDDLDLWKVDAPQVLNNDSHAEEKNFPLDQSKDSTLDPLISEIEGWGFAPNNSLEEKFQKIFPPVIEEASDVRIIDRLQTSSQFVNDYDFPDEGAKDVDATDPSFEVPEDLNRSLLNEIDNEISAEAFWAVDEILPRKSEEEEDISDTNLDEVTADLTESVQAFREKESINIIQVDKNIDQDELVEKLKLALRPMIEEMVKEYCRQSAEKVAWEVIPDLAENLIRKEIKEISDSVRH